MPYALLFPIDWPEPFGLVMIEALACGTPVIAWRNGSVPEIIDDGRTGFIVDNLDDAVRAVATLGQLSRAACRAAFVRRFDAALYGVELRRSVPAAHCAIPILEMEIAESPALHGMSPAR